MPNPPTTNTTMKTANAAPAHDQQVEDRGERAGSDPRDLEVEGDVLRRLHLEPLPVVGSR